MLVRVPQNAVCWVRWLGCTAALLFFAANADGDDRKQNWPSWRGPLRTGVAPQANPPVEWSENRNVRWKVKLPGLGHSSPVVWGDSIFLTTAIPYGPKLPPVPV